MSYKNKHNERSKKGKRESTNEVYERTGEMEIIIGEKRRLFG